MKIYVDLVLLLNFLFDFLLLSTVSVLLKRRGKVYKLLLGSFFGSLSTLLLFFEMTNLSLFVFKFVISVFMIIISFRFKNIKYFMKNMAYLYMVSILLGGFLYFLNISFSYKNKGLIFFHNGLSINFIILLLTSPVILFLYVKQSKDLKNSYNCYHSVVIYLDKVIIDCIGYLDTGNKIVDPYFHRSIIFINDDCIKDTGLFNILVPYKTIGDTGLIKCVKPRKIEIDGINFNALVGLTKEKIELDGVDCILPNSVKEIIC